MTQTEPRTRPEQGFRRGHRRVHWAWWVAVAAFVTLIGAAGFRAVPSVLIDPLHDEFGWPRATISAAVSINLVLFGLISPFAAALMDTLGMRRVVAGALVMVAAGSGLTVFMTASWHLLLCWGVLVGVGTGSMSMAFVATVTSRWFVRHRGLVSGILTAAGATGQLVFLPLVATLATDHGWRTPSLIVAAAALAVVPLILTLLRDHPADVGTTAYGTPTTPDFTETTPSSRLNAPTASTAAPLFTKPTPNCPVDGPAATPTPGSTEPTPAPQRDGPAHGTAPAPALRFAEPAPVPQRDGPADGTAPAATPDVADDAPPANPDEPATTSGFADSGQRPRPATSATSAATGDTAPPAPPAAPAPPGAPGATADPSPPATSPVPPSTNSFLRAVHVLRAAARTRTFWLLAAGFAICGASTNGLVGTHFVSAAHDHGMPHTTAASLLALIGIFDIAGTVMSGWLTDRVDPRLLLGGYYTLRGLSLLVLPSLFAPGTEPSMWVFIVFYGLDWIATVPPTVALCRDRFGESGPVVFGWVFASHQVGAAVAALGAGAIRDLEGSYDLAWFLAGGLCVVAALLSVAIRPIRDPLLAETRR